MKVKEDLFFALLHRVWGKKIKDVIGSLLLLEKLNLLMSNHPQTIVPNLL